MKRIALNNGTVLVRHWLRWYLVEPPYLTWTKLKLVRAQSKQEPKI